MKPRTTALILTPLATAITSILIRGRIRPKNTRDRFGTILVLGTAQYNGVPSRQFAARLRWAADLWHMLGTQKIITVGGKLPGDTTTEAEAGRAYLLQAKVAPDYLQAIPEGNDTLGSYEAALPSIVGGPHGSVLIVTDPNHALRAELLAKQVGMNARVSPTPYCPARFPTKSFFWTLSHEVGGIIVVTTTALLGRKYAATVEDLLRYAQGILRPSRVARHQVLRDQNT